MNNPLTIGITGSNGFIGSRLVTYFADAGYTVHAFQRKPSATTLPNVTYHPFDLSAVTDDGFAGLDYLVHCAYQPAIGANRGLNVNRDGTKKLIALCRQHDTRMIFLSTLSAHSRAKSQYGKDKLLMESMFDAPTDLVLKLGLILGEGGGLFGRISDVLATKKIIPLVGGNKQIQTLALGDLCRVIEYAMRHHLSETKLVAHPEKIQLRDLYTTIAAQRGARPVFIPMPILPAYYVLRLTESFGLHLPIHSENVLGVQCLEIFDTQKDSESFGFTFQNTLTTLQHMHTDNTSPKKEDAQRH